MITNNISETSIPNIAKPGMTTSTSTAVPAGAVAAGVGTTATQAASGIAGSAVGAGVNTIATQSPVGAAGAVAGVTVGTQGVTTSTSTVVPTETVSGGLDTIDRSGTTSNPGTVNKVDPKILINNGYQIKANAEDLKLTIKKVKEELVGNLKPVLSSAKIDFAIDKTLTDFERTSNSILDKVYAMSEYIAKDVAQQYEQLDAETAKMLEDLSNISNFDLSNYNIVE